MFRHDCNLKKLDQKVWLSSPTMYEDSMRYVMEAYETNWMSTVGENVDEVDCKYGAAGDMAFDATVNPIVYEGGIPVFVDTEYDTWNMYPASPEKAFDFTR